MERRTFLKTTVAGFAGLGSAHGDPRSGLGIGTGPIIDPPQDDFQAPAWLGYSRGIYFDGYSPPVYPHMKDFDAKRLLQVVVELGGDSIRFKPIAYWAYYPSKAFRVHPELGDRDLINEVTQECHRTGIHCYCYTGYMHPHMEVGWADQHPKYADWVLRDPQGKPYGTYSHYGDLVQRVCFTGNAYRAGMHQVVKELCEHDIEGVYFDAPSAFGYTGICFCDDCRVNFKKFSGMDLDRLNSMAKLNGLPPDWGEAGHMLPVDVDMQALTAWYAWANELTRQDLLEFRRMIHGSGKFMLCHNANAWTGPALPKQYRIPDGFMVEASREVHDRLMTGLMGASMVRPYKKFAQMYMGSYSVTWFNEPPHEVWAVHNTDLEDSDEIRMEGFTELACGNAPFYATSNRLYFNIGSGSAEPAKEVYRFMQHVEGIHRHSVPVSYLTIMPTWGAMQLWRTKRKSWNWPMMSGGMGLALLDERISFDVNPSTEMSEEWLKRQRVIALCGASGMSDEEAKRLTAWVEQGGALLATYDSGLYNEQGQLRTDGGALREVLGVEMKGEPLESQTECYYRVKEAHAALGEYGPGSLVLGDARLVPAGVRSGAMILAECWNLGTQQVRGPAIVANTFGQGRTLYISGSLEGNYLSDRVKSTARLLASVVNYLGASAPQPYKMTAPKGVYGIMRGNSEGDLMLWVLANVGFKDADSGRMRQEYVPVSDVEVGLRIPEGRRAKAMRLVRADREISFREENGYAVGTIPRLHIAELVHLRLA